MYLQSTDSHDLVEVLTLQELFDPCQNEITGRYHAGEEQQEPQSFSKNSLSFPSGEPLPACWTDPEYRSKH